MIDLTKSSLSHNTLQAYKQALTRCEVSIGDWRHISDKDFAKYLTSMFQDGLSPSTINLAAAALKHSAQLEGLQAPIGHISKLTLAGISRSTSEKKHGQAKPVLWEESESIAKNIVSKKMTGLRDAAIFMASSDALLRRSEVVAINVEDIEYDDSIALLHIRKSKSDQTGKGAVMFLGELTTEYIQRWIRFAEIDSGALFRPIYKENVVDRRLCDKTVARIITRRCKEHGIIGARGHSLRVGGAVSLAASGGSLVDIQKVGRWESPVMPAKYAANEDAKRGPVARFRYNKKG